MNSDLSLYLINENLSVKDALEKVEINQHGFIFTHDKENRVTGLVTDGDIRRALIDGATINDKVSAFINRDFLSASLETPREKLIKNLDGHIQFIPILDKESKLHSIVSKDHLPIEKEKSTYLRARAPATVSFGGGGSDLTHYFDIHSGAVINSAISIYSHAAMRVREDNKVIIRSLDLGQELIADNLQDALSVKGDFGLIQSLLHVVQPRYGFELYLNSDFSVGSGLGGSATVSAAILGCFNMLRHDKWNDHEIAQIAFQAERLHLGVAGGWQDQYASVFGGFNFIEFNADENIVNPIRIDSDVQMELEECLILCNTNLDHHSGNIHEDQKKEMSSNDVQNMVKANVKLCYETRNHLLKGKLNDFGKCLDQAWQLKRNFSSMISSPFIDNIYQSAKDEGAIGGKLLGAGGGGFFIFYVPLEKKHKLISYLRSEDLTIQNFRFEPNGLQAWACREDTNKNLI